MRIRLHDVPKPKKPDRRCMCSGPIYVVIPAGTHRHLCPIHPEVATFGPQVHW